MYKGSASLRKGEMELYDNAPLSPVTFDGRLNPSMNVSYEGFEDQPDVGRIEELAGAVKIGFFKKTVGSCGVTESCDNVMKFVTDTEFHFYALDSMTLLKGDTCSGNPQHHCSFTLIIMGSMFPGPVPDIRFTWGNCTRDDANFELLVKDLKNQTL